MTDLLHLGPRGTRQSLVRAYELTLVAVIAGEYWFRGLPRWGQLGTQYYWLTAIATLSAALVFVGRYRRQALTLLGLNHAVLVWYEFPSVGNHAYLEAGLCLLGGLLRIDDPRELALYHGSVRWMTGLIFFYSGLQKYAHGFWGQGEFLAYSLTTSESFRKVLAPLVSADDLARLLGYHGEAGDGPYRLLSSPLLLAVSHTVWVIEMAVAPLLWWSRTRRFGVLVATGVVLAIEAGAREFGFGLVFLAMITACLDTDVSRRTLPIFLVVLVLLLLVRVHVLPELTYY